MKAFLLIVLICFSLCSCIAKEKSTVDSDNAIDNLNMTAKNDCIRNSYAAMNKAKSNLNHLSSLYSELKIELNHKIDSIAQTRPPSYFGCIYTEEHRKADTQIRQYRNQKTVLDKSYDDKYTQHIAILEEELKAIEKCNLFIGESNWFDQYGRTNYNIMADKYKRKQS